MLWPARVPPDTPGYGWLAKEDTGPRIPFSFTSSHSIELHGGRCVAAASGRAPLTERARVRTSRERHCCSVANCLFAMRIFPERVPLEAETRVGKARFFVSLLRRFLLFFTCALAQVRQHRFQEQAFTCVQGPHSRRARIADDA